MNKRITKLLLSLILVGAATTTLEAASPKPVSEKNSMVVSAQHYASEIGKEILEKGGNAVDAAVAMGYALAVVHPCCGNIGGGGFMLIRFADGKSTFFNFREKTPEKVEVHLFLDESGKTIKLPTSAGHLTGFLKHSYLTVGTPGTVMGLNLALEKYGSMHLKDLIQPAINLAEKGYVLQEGDLKFLQYGSKFFKEQENVAEIFLKSGKPYEEGDTIVQKNLAESLMKIQEGGTKAFYEGEITEEIVSACKQNGGKLSKLDFQNYTVEEMEPIKCSYRGYEIITSPPPSSGGVTICQVLTILDGYPFDPDDFHSAKATHYTVEALRYAYADRARYLGDPDFVKNPVDRMISKEYAEQIRQHIKPNEAGDSNKMSQISEFKETENTTAYVVVDKYGNVVSVTYTLNNYFGARVIAGKTGFFLNNQMDDFTLLPNVPNAFGLIGGSKNVLAPNKRPLSSMAPTIVTKDNKLVMILSTPGGATIPTQLISVIQNVIDFGMDIQEAIDAPRFHMQWKPDVIYYEPYTFSADTMRILKNMGHTFKEHSPYGSRDWGGATGILYYAPSGRYHGGIDSRRPAGSAVGY